MQNDLHIFIIWQNALHIKEKIISDINQHFEIRKIFNCHWPQEDFALHLSNFYHKKLYHCCKKEKECGNGDFLLIVVSPKNPKHHNMINTKICRLKHKYRQWSKGEFLIHASDSQKEAKENLLYLTGISEEEFNHKYHAPWDGNIETINFLKLNTSKRQRILLKLCRIIRALL